MVVHGRSAILRGAVARGKRRAEASAVTSSLVRRLMRHEIRMRKGSRDSSATTPTAVGLQSRLVLVRVRTMRLISATVRGMAASLSGAKRVESREYSTTGRQAEHGGPGGS